MRVRTITRVDKFYYGIFSQTQEFFQVTMQRIGDRGWMVKPEKYYSFEAAKEAIKAIEKEFYDAKRNKDTEAHTQAEKT